MNAAELRIGNLVQDRHSEECGMIDIVVLGIIDAMENHSYQPIPLTEEWLKRFGFEKYNLNNFTLSWGGVLFYYRISDRSFRKGYQVMEKICFTEVKYVHQLQNLYHALTGEELINQNKEDE